MAYDLFLAHASAEKPAAVALHDALTTRGVRAFLDARSIGPGERWDLVIPRAQRDSRATVVLVPRVFDKAFYLGDEVASAIDLHRKAPEAHAVIPAYLDGMPTDTLAIPYGLRVLNALDATALGGLDALADRLRELVATWRALPPPAPSPAAPTPPAAPDPRCAPDVLHQRLCRLVDVQFETVVLYAGVDRSLLAAPSAPQSQRALDLARLVALGDPSMCRRVCDAIAKVAPSLP